jgi:ribokinase
VRDDEEASGIALIVVDKAAENIIAVASGANGRLSPADVRAAEPAIKEADGMLLQLEIPLDAVRAAIDLARQYGVRTILNPAPARQLPADVLREVDVLTPNENEAAGLTGDDLDPARDVLAGLVACEPRTGVVMTRGAAGCEVVSDGKRQPVPGFRVEAVDTTGAGDCFNGALAVALARGSKLVDAARYANAAAALAVTRFGAQTSMPTDEEVRQFRVFRNEQRIQHQKGYRNCGVIAVAIASPCHR